MWSRDGRTLYFPHGRQIIAVALRFEPTVSLQATRVVVEGDYALDDGLHAAFDVDANGDIILVRPVRDARTVVIRNLRAAIRGARRREGATEGSDAVAR